MIVQLFRPTEIHDECTHCARVMLEHCTCSEFRH